MTNIIWTTTTIGKGKPFYTASHGKWDAKVTDQGACYNLQVLFQGGSFEMWYGSSIAACKNQFRKFLKKRGEL